mgnify:FL=1
MKVNHGMVVNMEGPSWEKKTSGFFPRREYLSLRAPKAIKEGEQVLKTFEDLCNQMNELTWF